MSEEHVPAEEPIFQPPTLEEMTYLLPQYEMEGFIAQGGMGAVYLARQPSLDRHVAVKVLPPNMGGEMNFTERFQIEARAMARLQHGNIVSVYDFGVTAQQHLYLVMEYVDGDMLHNLIHTGAVTPEHALSYALQLCDALQYAHDHGIIHRDIKPSNVLISTEGRVKVADFGLARPTAAHEHEVMMGTPDYAAPEIMQGAPVDHRADIFAFGVLIYEMLTRAVPKQGRGPASAIANVDTGWDDVITKATRLLPKDRYQHVKEMRVALSHIANRRRRFNAPGGVMRPMKNAPAAVAQPEGGAFTRFVLGLIAIVVVISVAGKYAWPALREKLLNQAGKAGLQVTPDLAGSTTKKPKYEAYEDEVAPPAALNINLANAPAGHVVKYPRGHKDGIRGIVMLPDQQRALSVSTDHTMKLWRVMTGELLHTFKTSSPINSVAVSPDGQMAATGGSDNRVRLWDLENGSMKGEVEANGKNTTGIEFSSSGRAIIFASSTKKNPVQIWTNAEGTQVSSLTGWTHPVNAMCSIPGLQEGAFLTVGGTPKSPDAAGELQVEICLGNFQQTSPVRVLKPSEGMPTKVTASADGRYVAIAFGRLASIIDLKAEETIAQCRGHSERIDAMCFLDGGRLLLTGSEDESLRIWETATGQEVWRAALDEVHAANSFAVSKDETFVISGGGYEGGKTGLRDDEFVLHLWKLPVLAGLKTEGAAQAVIKRNAKMNTPAAPDTELEQVKAQIEADWQERVVKGNEAALEKLDTLYTNALRNALATAAPADRSAILNEISRVTNKGAAPAATDPALPAVLQRLVKTYLDQIALIKQKEPELAKSVLTEHLAKLSTLEAQRKTQGDEKAAARVKALAEEWTKAHS